MRAKGQKVHENGHVAELLFTFGLVSYLAASGYTLTVVLNFSDRQLIGVASSAKEWFPVRGTFAVVT